MADARSAILAPPVRAEFENTTLDTGLIGEVARPLSFWERRDQYRLGPPAS